MANLKLIVLVLAICYSVSTSSAAATTRNLYQFKNMINHKGYSSMEYLDYGCWCGWGGSGALAVDQTDYCCYVHDNCYGEVAGEGLFTCEPKLVTYAWTGLTGNQIQCTDPIGTCDRNVCECDKAAAECFAKHRSTYNSKYFNLQEDICSH